MCLLLYSCLLLPFFSHIADMPGLACLNRLSTEVKSKSSPVCDCTTAAHALQKKQSALRKGRVRCGCWCGCWRAPVCVQLATKWHMVFSAAQVQTGLLPACFFGSSSGSAWCSSCCCILVLSLRMPVACILELASLLTGMHGHYGHKRTAQSELGQYLHEMWYCEFIPAGLQK